MKIQSSKLQAPTEEPERKCRRCGCTWLKACWDSRLHGPCCWAGSDICSACLTKREFREFMAETPPMKEAA
jgi:hypothetical protein